jgi:hypothetical protein
MYIRCVPSIFSTMRAVAAASSIVSGSPCRVGADALEVAETRRVGSLATLVLGEAQRPRTGRQRRQPRAGRVHEMSLHVEDEVVAVERRACERQVERAFVGNVVAAAARPAGGVSVVEG